MLQSNEPTIIKLLGILVGNKEENQSLSKNTNNAVSAAIVKSNWFIVHFLPVILKHVMSDDNTNKNDKNGFESNCQLLMSLLCGTGLQHGNSNTSSNTNSDSNSNRSSNWLALLFKLVPFVASINNYKLSPYQFIELNDLLGHVNTVDSNTLNADIGNQIPKLAIFDHILQTPLFVLLDSVFTFVINHQAASTLQSQSQSQSQYISQSISHNSTFDSTDVSLSTDDLASTSAVDNNIITRVLERLFVIENEIIMFNSFGTLPDNDFTEKSVVDTSKSNDLDSNVQPKPVTTDSFEGFLQSFQANSRSSTSDQIVLSLIVVKSLIQLFLKYNNTLLQSSNSASACRLSSILKSSIKYYLNLSITLIQVSVTCQNSRDVVYHHYNYYFTMILACIFQPQTFDGVDNSEHYVELLALFLSLVSEHHDCNVNVNVNVNVNPDPNHPTTNLDLREIRSIILNSIQDFLFHHYKHLKIYDYFSLFLRQNDLQKTSTDTIITTITNNNNSNSNNLLDNRMDLDTSITGVAGKNGDVLCHLVKTLPNPIINLLVEKYNYLSFDDKIISPIPQGPDSKVHQDQSVSGTSNAFPALPHYISISCLGKTFGDSSLGDEAIVSTFISSFMSYFTFNSTKNALESLLSHQLQKNVGSINGGDKYSVHGCSYLIAENGVSIFSSLLDSSLFS